MFKNSKNVRQILENIRKLRAFRKSEMEYLSREAFDILKNAIANPKTREAVREEIIMPEGYRFRVPTMGRK